MPVPVSETRSSTYGPARRFGPVRGSLVSSSMPRASKTSCPPSGIASRALTARLTRTCSNCAGSMKTCPEVASGREITWMWVPTRRRIISARPSTATRTSSASGEHTCLRLNARSWRVSAAARCAVDLSCVRPLIAVRKILSQRAGEGEDDGEDVVEVVSYAAGELPNGLHLLRLREVLLQHCVLALLLVEVRDHAVEGARQLADLVARCQPEPARAPLARRHGLDVRGECEKRARESVDDPPDDEHDDRERPPGRADRRVRLVHRQVHAEDPARRVQLLERDDGVQPPRVDRLFRPLETCDGPVEQSVRALRDVLLENAHRVGVQDHRPGAIEDVEVARLAAAHRDGPTEDVDPAPRPDAHTP